MFSISSQNLYIKWNKSFTEPPVPQTRLITISEVLLKGVLGKREWQVQTFGEGFEHFEKVLGRHYSRGQVRHENFEK